MEGDWELVNDGGLILDKLESGLYSPPLDEGRYTVTVRLEHDKQTVEQTITILVAEPVEQEPEPDPDASVPEPDTNPDRVAELEARVRKLENLLSSILNFQRGVNGDGS